METGKEPHYTVMSLLGFKEVLERIARIEEILAKIKERQQKLEEIREARRVPYIATQWI